MRTVSVIGTSTPKSVFVDPMTRVANEKVAPDSAHCGGLNLRRILRKYAATGATHSSTDAHPAGLARQSTTVHPAVSARAGPAEKTVIAANNAVPNSPVERHESTGSLQTRTAVRNKNAPAIGPAGAACRIDLASVTIRIGKAARD